LRSPQREQEPCKVVTRTFPSHGNPVANRQTAERLTDMAERGCTAHEIMSVSGHLTLKELERYTRLADRARSAKAAMRKAGRNRKGTETAAPIRP
jgi:hypothetical protein